MSHGTCLLSYPAGTYLPRVCSLNNSRIFEFISILPFLIASTKFNWIKGQSLN